MTALYQKGDYIRYAAAGVCLIEDIKKIDYTHSHKPQDFYVLKPVAASGSTIYVPLANEELTAKMRYILNHGEIDSLIESMKNEKIEWIDDRKERTESFKAVIKRCEPQELLRLVSCIYLKKQEFAENGKKLSATDDSILSQAETLIENEFSFVLNLSGGQVGEYIRQKLGIE
ncbi:MAG: CarD family transcriptional regulator [Clostridia bacterium]|nr:CarD family transcriptional regulator [Clostridia bacterium]